VDRVDCSRLQQTAGRSAHHRDGREQWSECANGEGWSQLLIQALAGRLL